VGTLIGTKDAALFRRVTEEVAYLVGMEVLYWRLDRGATTKDALYGETVVESYIGPKELTVFVENPEKRVETGDEGLRREYDAQVWIPIRVWSGVFFEEKPWLGDQLEAWGKRFDVVGVHREGVINDDRDTFVQYRLDLKVQEKFAPERRM